MPIIETTVAGAAMDAVVMIAQQADIEDRGRLAAKLDMLASAILQRPGSSTDSTAYLTLEEVRLACSLREAASYINNDQTPESLTDLLDQATKIDGSSVAAGIIADIRSMAV